jgi:prolyl-tRNA synthetase
MKQSELFTKTIKEDPKDEISTSAKLLIRAGFIDKLAAGIYSFLPLGLRVLRKIENIIREEMKEISGQEILMPALHPKEAWLPTGRWEITEMFKTKSRSGREYGLGWTHEEVVTPLVKKYVSSYKDLPRYVYQIQDKFRDELRPKSGLLRTKEFIMKDLYSFHATTEDLDDYYEKVTKAYFKIFERCELLDFTYLTLASGGAFSRYSDEFQTTAPAGEDTIYICTNCDRAINKEIKGEAAVCPECDGKDFKQEKSIEVGNIFKLGSRYSEPLGLKFKDKDGQEKPVMMGCYGLGPARIMGTIVEIFHDNQGIIWPQVVAPFKVHLILLGEEKDKKEANKLYENLRKANLEVLYDDRDVSAGEKFVDADLIGCPYRIVISKKTLAKDSIEIKKRGNDKIELVKTSNVIKELKK